MKAAVLLLLSILTFADNNQYHHRVSRRFYWYRDTAGMEAARPTEAAETHSGLA